MLLLWELNNATGEGLRVQKKLKTELLIFWDPEIYSVRGYRLSSIGRIFHNKKQHKKFASQNFGRFRKNNHLSQLLLLHKIYTICLNLELILIVCYLEKVKYHLREIEKTNKDKCTTTWVCHGKGMRLN